VKAVSGTLESYFRLLELALNCGPVTVNVSNIISDPNTVKFWCQSFGENKYVSKLPPLAHAHLILRLRTYTHRAVDKVGVRLCLH